MQQKSTLTTFVLTAALGLGLVASAAADDSRPAAPEPAAGATGLLGQTYAGLTYSYVNLKASPVNADHFSFEYNQSLNTGIDSVLSYDWTQAGLSLGDRANQQKVGAALRAFSTAHRWGKPYVEAGLGYTWTRSAGRRDNSLVVEGAVGAEFQVAPALTVTPYVRYELAHDLAADRHGVWSYGVKANLWADHQWSLTGGIARNDNRDTLFTAGTNFRF